eukprot:2414460-Prymnesium_polylepis.1
MAPPSEHGCTGERRGVRRERGAARFAARFAARRPGRGRRRGLRGRQSFSWERGSASCASTAAVAGRLGARARASAHHPLVELKHCARRHEGTRGLRGAAVVGDHHELGQRVEAARAHVHDAVELGQRRGVACHLRAGERATDLVD